MKINPKALWFITDKIQLGVTPIFDPPTLSHTHLMEDLRRLVPLGGTLPDDLPLAVKQALPNYIHCYPCTKWLGLSQSGAHFVCYHLHVAPAALPSLNDHEVILIPSWCRLTPDPDCWYCPQCKSPLKDTCVKIVNAPICLLCNSTVTRYPQ